LPFAPPGQKARPDPQETTPAPFILLGLGLY
jgi:hypothetical protein